MTPKIEEYGSIVGGEIRITPEIGKKGIMVGGRIGISTRMKEELMIREIGTSETREQGSMIGGGIGMIP